REEGRPSDGQGRDDEQRGQDLPFETAGQAGPLHGVGFPFPGPPAPGRAGDGGGAGGRGVGNMNGCEMNRTWRSLSSMRGFTKMLTNDPKKLSPAPSRRVSR